MVRARVHFISRADYVMLLCPNTYPPLTPLSCYVNDTELYYLQSNGSIIGAAQTTDPCLTGSVEG